MWFPQSFDSKYTDYVITMTSNSEALQQEFTTKLDTRLLTVYDKVTESPHPNLYYAYETAHRAVKATLDFCFEHALALSKVSQKRVSKIIKKGALYKSVLSL